MPLSIQAVKLSVAFIIFLCGLVSTGCPLCIAAGTNATLFSAGNMMAAGVLLAAGLVHQLADSVSSSLNNSSSTGGTSNNSNEDNNDYPWSFFICGLTFLLFLILEESVHLLFAGNHGHDHGRIRNEVIEMEGGGCAASTAHCHSSCRGSFVIPGIDQVLETTIKMKTDYGTSTTSSCQNHSHEKQPLKMRQRRAAPDKDDSTRTNFVSSRRASKLSVTVFGEPREEAMMQHHHHDNHISEHLHGSLLAALLLLMALSIHSVLAGLSIGIVHDTKDIYATAVAIVAHKVFAGYALGSTMAASGLGYGRCVFLGIIFSLSTPLGIFIGIGLNGSYDENSSSVGIVQAIVAGTFLYVSIMEVGMKELLICRHDTDGSGPLHASLSQKQLEALKLFSMLVGFAGMSFLAAFV